MDEEQIHKYLKNNLSIHLEAQENNNGRGFWLTVELRLAKSTFQIDTISKQEIFVQTKSDED
jgi:hypothetical protein